MHGKVEYRFVIDRLTPATLPMARLAEYMGDLAMLLGERERVHFAGIEDGSVVLIQTIEAAAVPLVAERLRSLDRPDAPADALRAFDNLDRRLAQDDATATLSSSENADTVRFAGRERQAELAYGAIRQQGSLDGMLVRIGGKDESVHATLMDGTQTWRCELTREMARELREHLYERPLRVFGEGRWRRDRAGKWQLDRFRITHFEVLDDATWQDTVARLRSIEGADWRSVADPIAELVDLRGGGEEPPR